MSKIHVIIPAAGSGSRMSQATPKQFSYFHGKTLIEWVDFIFSNVAVVDTISIAFSSDEKNNIDQAISSFKPPIFWKDKSLVIQQARSWKKWELKNLIYKSNEIELLIKKNSAIGKNILSDFIINNSKKTNN